METGLTGLQQAKLGRYAMCLRQVTRQSQLLCLQEEGRTSWEGHWHRRKDWRFVKRGEAGWKKKFHLENITIWIDEDDILGGSTFLSTTLTLIIYLFSFNRYY